MSLSQGRQYHAIPGPSVMPDRVLRAMHRAAPNIYEGELVDMMPGLLASLRGVARTTGHVAIYICNGHGAWEASLANVAAPGERVLCLATGAFGYGWAETGSAMGLDVELLDFGKRTPVDLTRVEAALAEDRDHRIKAVLTTHTDTTTSIRSDIAALRAAMDRTGHPTLLMVDAIASLGCDDVRMDDWGIDVLIAASQKGLMTPPGVGFVFFNDKAAAVRKDMQQVSPYWDWTPRVEPELFYLYFCGTAPTHLLYGLREALSMIEEEGLDNAHRRHGLMARAIWAAVDHWGGAGPLELNLRTPDLRSHSVTSIRTGTEKARDLRRWCEHEAGVTLGIGLGMAPPGSSAWNGFFRIGHMGHFNPHMILGMLASIEAGLGVVGIDHAPGGIVAAAEIVAKG